MKMALGMESAVQNAMTLQGGGKASAASSEEVLKLTLAKLGNSKQQMSLYTSCEGLVIALQNAGSWMPSGTIAVKRDM